MKPETRRYLGGLTNLREAERERFKRAHCHPLPVPADAILDRLVDRSLRRLSLSVETAAYLEALNRELRRDRARYATRFWTGYDYLPLPQGRAWDAFVHGT